MKSYTVYQIDAFTRAKFKGNPAGVVVNAEGLSSEQMLLIAGELKNSETAFLFPADEQCCDGIIRYFTPTMEVPSCGHATIAAMYAKAREENLDSCILNYKTKIGVLPFEIIKQDDHEYSIVMTQGTIQIDAPLDAGFRNRIIAALGLTAEDMDLRCPVQVASTGHSIVVIGIKERNKLHGLTPDLSLLMEISKEINCNCYHVFTFDSEEDDILVHGRMFAPAIGIPEDPVTGNANGPLGAYLVQNRIVHVEGDVFEFTAKQGEKMGRPGLVEVLVNVNGQVPELVRTVGEAVIAFKTEIEI